MRRILLALAVLTLISCQNSVSRQPASLLSNCFESMARLLGMRKQYFTPEELDDIGKLGREWYYSPMPFTVNESDMMPFLALEKAPDKIKRLIFEAPEDLREFSQYFSQLSSAWGKDEHFLRSLVEHFRTLSFRIKRDGKDHREWIIAGIRKWASMSQEMKDEVIERFYARYDYYRAFKYFEKSLYADIKLFKEGRKTFTLIKGHKVQVVEKKGYWIFHVPKELIGSRADNALQSHIIKEKAMAGGRAPSIYSADLAINGKFYLHDANHRFALFESRAIIPVKVSSLRTIKWRESAGYLGLLNPKEDKILKFFRGEISLEEFMESRFYNDLAWREDELFMADKYPEFPR